MPTTTRMGWVWPTEGQPDWYDIYEALITQQDADVYASLENHNLILRGGGIVSLDTGADEMTWTEDFEILDVLTGGVVTISADTLAGVEDGKVVYVEVSRPITGASTKTLAVGDTIGDNHNKLFIALRRGSELYLRGGGLGGGGAAFGIMTDSVTTGSAASGGGTVTGEIDVGLLQGVIWELTLDANGNTTDTDIELFRDSGLSDKVWEATGLDAYTSQYVKEFIKWGAFTEGKVHYKLTNNGANASTYDIGLYSFGQVD